MSDLTEFLSARIAEDEAVAWVASPGPWSYAGGDSVGGWTLYDPQWSIASMTVYDEDVRRVNQPLSNKPGATGPADVDPDANGAHIARHDPARVLAECESKRRIMARWATCAACADEGNRYEARVLGWVMAHLALPYADHPDYCEEWRP